MEKKKIKKFMFQLISAVQKVHQEKFMHRDIKPENILLDKEYGTFVFI